MLNGLSLFSGYAGIDIALSEYVRPIMYCEIEKYPQGILISRMDEGSIPFAPIWNDVASLDGKKLKGLVDIIYGGFPCQDISVAGKGVGLEGKRSGLFFEIVRLAREINPTFLFLENVPAIRTRGALAVQQELSKLGYDTRWTTLSAAEIGANHKRERWFCLATNTKRIKIWKQSGRSTREIRKNSTELGDNGKQGFMANTMCKRLERQWESSGIQSELFGFDGSSENLPDSDRTGLSKKGAKLETAGTSGNDLQRDEKVSNANCSGLCGQTDATEKESNERVGQDHRGTMPSPFNSDWWTIEPNVGRVVNGVKFRVDRIKALGNGVVPLQVKTAYEILIGKKRSLIHEKTNKETD